MLKLNKYPVVISLLLVVTFVLKVNSQNKVLKNGLWFDNEQFQKKDIFIKNGIFSFSKPDTIHQEIDLQGKFILPPYAETHTHNLTSDYGVDHMISQYLNEGILYIQVLGGSQKGRKAVKNKIGKSLLEVSYSNGGITCTLGHPFTIYEPLAMRIHSPIEKRKRAKEIRDSRLAENDAYWFFDNIKDVDNKWNKLLETKPDALKIMLLHSNQYDSLYADTSKLGGKGISPEVAKYVVQKAKTENLQVFAHVESAFDFRTAVNIGVDVIAHIPGYAWNGDDSILSKYILSDKDLLAAAKQDITIITTASLSKNYAKKMIDGKRVFDQQRQNKIINYQRELIRRILEFGVTLSIGSDQYGKTLFEEVDYLSQNTILNNLQIINLICEINPKLIFPNRKIGKIQDGYEANFIVVNANPLKDISNLKNVEDMYIKGNIIQKK